MSRTKRLIALLCALCLCAGLARAEDLIASDAIVPEVANYRTSAVVRSDYIQTSSAGASEVYPLTYRARYEGATARFVRLLVKKGDEVKAGDVIAELELNASTVSLEEKELSLQRAREAYEEGLLERREAVSAAQQAFSAAQDEYAREDARLALEKARLEMEKYRCQQERAIARAQEEIDELRKDYESTLVCAPADGVISDVAYYKEGEPVYSGATLATLYSTDKLLLRVKNDSGSFRYNLPVTVETGVAKERVTLSGRVVATDLLLPANERTQNVAYVLLDDAQDANIRNSQATCESVVVRDVLLVPRSALTLEAGNYYVSKLVDGRVEKRFVNARLSATPQQWLLQGLDEGDLIIQD